MVHDEPVLPGRQAEARRNDAAVLAAALDVLAADPGAPMSAVSRRAGVGQATLYRRYPHRNALVVAVCERGIAAIAEAAAAGLQAADPRRGLVDFLGWYAASGQLRMTRLLGTFTPPPALLERAHRANRDMQAMVERAARAGLVRADVTGADLTMIAVQLSAVEGSQPARTAELRTRYLALQLQALGLDGATDLPGPAPTAAELETPWLRG